MRRRSIYIYGIIILLAFILYGNTISHDYAFDDSLVITNNEFTKKGLRGIEEILSNDTFQGRIVNKRTSQRAVDIGPFP